METSVRPAISVIMGIYNCSDTLRESLDSLVDQTFQDFEVVMCDDGSTDVTAMVAQEYCNKYPTRFRLLTNSKNRGLNFTLNKCLEEAAGRYIARMDGDDISLPDRFQEEIQYLESDPDLAFVSTAAIHFDEEGDWGINRSKENPQAIDFVKGSPFNHAACMVRKEAYAAVGGYSVDPGLLRVEDYHLWIKMYGKGFKGYNIQEPLYKVRDDRNATNRRTLAARINEMRVKKIAINTFDLPVMTYLFLLKPLILAFLPKKIYEKLHRSKMNPAASITA